MPSKVGPARKRHREWRQGGTSISTNSPAANGLTRRGFQRRFQNIAEVVRTRAPRKFLSLRSWWRDPLRMIEDLKRGAARNADQGDPARLEREIEMPLPEARFSSGRS